MCTRAQLSLVKAHPGLPVFLPSSSSLLLASESIAAILTKLSMEELSDLLVLIVFNAPESFMPSYSDGFALFVEPHGQSFQDLVNLLPARNRDLLTKITAATRHWAQYEAVDVVGRTRGHSIDSCSRDDLSLTSFGDLCSQELPPVEEGPNRTHLQRLANVLFRTAAKSADNSNLAISIDGSDALEALENLILLHECIDQLEAWKVFSDTHAALSLPPWRERVKKDDAPANSQSKAVMIQSTTAGRSDSPIVAPKGDCQPHNVSALIPQAPPSHTTVGSSGKGLSSGDDPSSDDRYDYKTSYWQFRHRQVRTHHSALQGAGMELEPPCSVHPCGQTRDIQSLEDKALLSADAHSNASDPAYTAAEESSERISSATMPQIATQIEFITPPMKDIYSTKLITAAIHPPERPKSPTFGDPTTPASSLETPSSAVVENPTGKAHKKQPPPFASITPPSTSVLSQPTTTTSMSPTTADSLITKMSILLSTDQDGSDGVVAKKAGWRIWDRPLMPWRRKSTSSLPTQPDASVPSVPSLLVHSDLLTSFSRTSTPIAVPAISSKQSSATATTVSRVKKQSKRQATTSKGQSQQGVIGLGLGLSFQEPTGTTIPSSGASSLRASPSSTPVLGCSIASIPFPEDYMSISLSHSNSNSVLWSAPPVLTQPAPVGSPSMMDSLLKVASFHPSPISPKKRLQEKLFGKKIKKSSSSSSLQDTSDPSFSASPSLPLAVTSVHHGAAPSLKSASSLGSLRDGNNTGSRAGSVREQDSPRFCWQERFNDHHDHLPSTLMHADPYVSYFSTPSSSPFASSCSSPVLSRSKQFAHHSNDDKESNEHIWKVIGQWDAYRDTHATK
ncbi:hypothetical protein BGX23_006037 [Mortierella sp. AD031]|nr:hypothetical protein BGX23_006037 [Mortierella sp. AD031]